MGRVYGLWCIVYGLREEKREEFLTVWEEFMVYGGWCMVEEKRRQAAPEKQEKKCK